MNSRLPRMLAFAGIVALVVYLVWRGQPPAPEPLPPMQAQSVPAAAPATPAAQIEIAIQDGKTIDFSSGSPQVRDTAADQAAIQSALQEMQEATKDIQFSPAAKQP